MPDQLHFDAATHTYTVAGTVYPSVTQIIKAAGLIDSEWFNEEATTRGTLVHFATALYDQSRLNWAKVPDEVRGSLAGWIGFRRESKCEILEIETCIYDGYWCFAGTRDRLIKLNNVTSILDIKTGAKVFWHPYQTAGYRLLHPVPRRFCIYLKPNGDYKLDPNVDGIDEHHFLACLDTYKVKKRNGLL